MASRKSSAPCAIAPTSAGHRYSSGALGTVLLPCQRHRRDLGVEVDFVNEVFERRLNRSALTALESLAVLRELLSMDVNPRRATRNQLLNSLDERGLRSAASYASSIEIAEQENERGLGELYNRVNVFKRVSMFSSGVQQHEVGAGGAEVQDGVRDVGAAEQDGNSGGGKERSKASG